MIHGPNTPLAGTYTQNHPFYRELKVLGFTEGVLRLIEPSLGHASESLHWLSDPEVGRFMGADFSQLSLEGEKERLQDLLENTDQYNWMIELDGKVIGNVCINEIAEETEKAGHKAGKIAILIGDKSMWGKGIARSVNAVVIDWAFREADFAELRARIMTENIASLRSFAALGFEPDGEETEQLGGRTVHWLYFRKYKESWLQRSK